MTEKEKKLFKISQARINALDDLLVCYRLGKRPSEKLFNRLTISKIAWDEIKKNENKNSSSQKSL